MLKENDIRPDELMAEQKRLFILDVRDLLKRRDKFVAVCCPACDSKEYKKEWRKYGLTFVRCKKCDTVFVCPRPTREVIDEYSRYSRNYVYWNKYIFPASENARREKIFKPRAELVRDLCMKYKVNLGTIVDVGAGFGTFCEEIKKLNLFKRVIAVEPNTDLADTCRKKGIETVERRIEDTKFRGKIDVITNFEVIEHLFSPKEFLLGCRAVLSRGGIVITTCPNIEGFNLKVTKEVSDTVDVEHLNYFHPESLALLLGICGFDVMHSSTPGQLDAELVRKDVLAGNFDISNQPFLKQILIDRWGELGEKFQNFLSKNMLSSNMLLIGKKRN